MARRLAAFVGLVLLLAGCGSTSGPGLRHVNTRAHLVALTFDDGPDPRYTPQVLRLLRRYHAHATFFLIGDRALSHRALLRAELAAGDEIGNHTWSHKDLRRLGDRAARQQIARGAAAIRAAGGPATTLFRPPGGDTDTEIGHFVQSDREQTILWSITIERYADHMPTALAVTAILRRVRPGWIILAHDGGPPNRSPTLTALPSLLQGLEERGYRIVTVGRLVAAGR